MILTISGLPGSGKSTVGKMLAKKLNYEYFSVGELRGKMALDRGMTIDEFNKLGEKEEWTDREADAKQAQLSAGKDRIIFEGRMSWHAIPDSFKIFLTVDLDEAAKRVFHSFNNRPDEKKPTSLSETKQALTKRLSSDKKRYRKYYGVDYTDPKNFDIVVDTTAIEKKQVLKLILDKIRSKE